MPIGCFEETLMATVFLWKILIVSGLSDLWALSADLKPLTALSDQSIIIHSSSKKIAQEESVPGGTCLIHFERGQKLTGDYHWGFMKFYKQRNKPLIACLKKKDEKKSC